MSVDETRTAVLSYLNAQHGDASALAEGVVFSLMSTGEDSVGTQAVLNMIDHLYHTAFDAAAESRNLIFCDDHAVLEADFVGKHTGEFLGIPATGKEVRVPMCIVYDVESRKIQRARIYFETPVLLEQLGVRL